MVLTRGQLYEAAAGTGPIVTKTITFDNTTGNGTVEAAATLSTNLTGANNDLTFTAVTTGAGGNSITIAYVDPAAPGAALSVSVTGNAITVNLATDGSSVITSTAAQVDAAIDALPAAAALVTPANKAANDGTGVVTAMTATALTGGTDGDVALFSVTGLVKAKVIGICSVDLAGATATLEVGTPLSTASIIAQTTGTNIDANEIWHDATPDSSVEATTVATERYVYQDIIATVKTAALTAGSITFYCQWLPVSDDGLVEAA